MKKHMLTAMVLLAGIGSEGASAQEPYMGEIRTFAFHFCPNSWAPLNGQLLPINQNQALFALLGTRYGGNGQTTFALPVGKPVYSLTGEPLLQCIALQGIFPPRD
jgi:microcystin-dependent protein